MALPFMSSTSLKRPLRIAAGLLGATLLFWGAMELWVQMKLPFIESALSAAARRPITVESAHYDIFRGFLFNNVEVRQNKTGFLPVRVGRLRIEPEFALIPRPEIRVRKIAFERPDIAMRLKPEDPLHLAKVLDGLSPGLASIGSLKVLVNFSSVEVRDGTLSLVSERDGQEWHREIQGIDFSARWTRSGNKFTEVIFKSGPVELKGQGEADLTRTSGHYRFLLSSGQVPLEKLAGLIKPLVPDAGLVQFYLTLDGDAKHFEPAAQAVLYGCSVHGPRPGFSLTDMEGVLRLSKNGFEARRLRLQANKTPLILNAHIQSERPGFVFKISTDPTQFSEKTVPASLKGAGILLKDGWSGYLRMRHGAEQWTLSLRGLGAGEKGSWACRFLRLRKEERAVKESTTLLSLRRIVMDLSGKGQYLRAEVHRAVYNGIELRANLWLRMNDLAWGASTAVKDADISKLTQGMSGNYPVTGRVTGDLSLKGLGGDIRCLVHFKVSEGMIGPSARLAYWAEQTGIEALKAVRFRSFSGEVAYEKGFWSLRYFRFAGDALIVAANLKMNSERIWGALSARFPTSSIRESSDLKWLLRYVRAEEWVDFDFKVAGHPASPRVQWLGGEFKKKVESRLAPWMRFELTRQIEKRLAERPVETTPAR